MKLSPRLLCDVTEFIARENLSEEKDIKQFDRDLYAPVIKLSAKERLEQEQKMRRMKILAAGGAIG